MLNALAEGETNPLALAALADQRLRASEAQLTDALGACTELHPVYRRLLPMALQELPFLAQPRDQREQEIAALLRQHEDAVQRLAEVPGWGVDSAQQIIAEAGATAATFASAKNLASWVGAYRAMRRARQSRRAIVPRKAVAICGAFSIKPATLRSEPQGVFFRWCIVGWCRA